MEATRVTVDEVKGVWIAVRRLPSSTLGTLKAWAEADTKLPARSAFRQMKWQSISIKFLETGPSSPTARDRTKHRAPVWRRH